MEIESCCSRSRENDRSGTGIHKQTRNSENIDQIPGLGLCGHAVIVSFDVGESRISGSGLGLGDKYSFRVYSPHPRPFSQGEKGEE